MNEIPIGQVTNQVNRKIQQAGAGLKTKIRAAMVVQSGNGGMRH